MSEGKSCSAGHSLTLLGVGVAFLTDVMSYKDEKKAISMPEERH